MSMENCYNCKFWLKYGASGQCRRNPPTQPGGHHGFEFPMIGGENWCGEYKRSSAPLSDSPPTTNKEPICEW